MDPKEPRSSSLVTPFSLIFDKFTFNELQPELISVIAPCKLKALGSGNGKECKNKLRLVDPSDALSQPDFAEWWNPQASVKQSWNI
jgi:hypothetical protein